MMISIFQWRAPRIHGELLKLGFDVSERTVSRWMQRASKDPDPARRWLVFLRTHRAAIAAMDFFTVPTLRFSVLYCLFVIDHDREVISSQMFAEEAVGMGKDVRVNSPEISGAALWVKERYLHICAFRHTKMSNEDGFVTRLSRSWFRQRS